MSELQFPDYQGNILVIDDTPANLKLLRNLLSEKGYQVRPMPSGTLALEGIHLNYPDLILLDINMPEMNGYDVCQVLKADERTRDIPVIFISAIDDIFDKIKAFEVGGVDYITKPFQVEEVLARVRTHLTLSGLQKMLQATTNWQDKQLAEQNAQLQEVNQRLEQANQQQIALNQELQKQLQKLEQTQLQLVQGEKMATLGQLTAGVAHEINNPVNFIAGNLTHTEDYVADLIHHLRLYQKQFPNPEPAIDENADKIDLEFVLEDLPKTIASMKKGTSRIRSISTSLRTFSRADTEDKAAFDIHDGIDSTLMILQHRLKANDNRPAIQIVKEYSNLLLVDCFPGQLNQVFMNIIANAIDALDEYSQERSYEEIERHPNQIVIRTEFFREGRALPTPHVVIRIADNGKGMSETVKQKIFEHLFTTKSVGQGTGLGLSIARQIVVEKHGGTLEIQSELGKGAEFAIALPLEEISP